MRRDGVGVVADPLGEGDSVTDARSSAHDAGMAQLLAFLGAMVGGGVQRSPAQVGLNLGDEQGRDARSGDARRDARLGMRGAMLWRLDERRGIVDGARRRRRRV